MYKEFKIIERLQNAYNATTMSCNKFANELNKIRWDKTFKADGELYFIKDKLVLTVENTNPFQEQWKPSYIIDTYYNVFE